MPKEVRFTVPGKPIAQPRQRGRIIWPKGAKSMVGALLIKLARVGNYTPAKHPVNTFKQAVQLSARNVYRGPLITGAVELQVVFVFPRPGRIIWKTREMPRQRHPVKPDADNTLKALKDALTKVVWKDDAQVSDTTVRKRYAAGDEQPHTEVFIRELELVELAE